MNTHPAASAEAAIWFKSSYSNATGGSCVEVADLTAAVGIRDSKDTSRTPVVVPMAAWAAFVDLVAAD
ncbi:DUF397 domain-containing protein [Streptomyces paludis]|uniref:DUF397 domain-containing protein n=1 Tax=Streptomyces paludis TaxID=2282738 RepID=A0A345I123_9ACTN|nr:DUF397 domain-containing protein [Streptomyces paludis]AXG82647.1 DUF397 domain-containing protein [Streptomyces paludis]